MATIYGGSGDNTVNGTSDPDSLYGGSGNDTVYGGSGEDLIFGGTGDDSIDGGNGADTQYGGSGDDTIDISNNADTAFGGDDADTIISSGSNFSKTVFGGEGGDDRDLLTWEGTTSSGDNVDVTFSSTEAGTASIRGQTVTFSQIEQLRGTELDDSFDATSATGGVSIDGGGGNDSISGGDGDDSLTGGTGDDEVYSGDGDDLVSGGSGDDSLFFGTGNDTVFGGDGDDFIDDVLGSNLTGTNVIYGGSGNDQVFTGFGSDTIYGGSGNDVINGEEDDDLIYGGAGDDVLTGGSGNDTFALTAGGGADTITDFSAGDRIDTSALTDGGGGSITADEVVVTGGGGSPQVLTFPNGESVQVADGTIDVSSPSAQFASLVAIGVPPCFAPGTRIATDRGEVPVESLKPGDRLMTLDRGAQTLLWIGRREQVFSDPDDDRHKPVRIGPGALGDGTPRAALIVSPQHRMMLSGPGVRDLFGEDEVLGMAKGLVGYKGIRRMRGKRKIVYYALLLARHEVIFAEGAATESFRPGPVALADFEPRVREQIYAHYPGLKDDPDVALGPPARHILTRRQVETLVAWRSGKRRSAPGEGGRVVPLRPAVAR